MVVRKVSFVLFIFSLLVGCSDRALPVSIIFDHEDYKNLSYEQLGLVLNSVMIKKEMFEDIKADPELKNILPAEIGKYDDFNDSVKSFLSYDVKEHKSHNLYQVTFFVDDQDVELSLIKLVKQQLDEFNAALGL